MIQKIITINSIIVFRVIYCIIRILLSFNNDPFDYFIMTSPLEKNEFLQDTNKINNIENVKYHLPLILRMYGTLNVINLRAENRYILCNFMDQYSDILNIDEDIYMTNNEKGLNQLLLLALEKAKKHNLINILYKEYLYSFKAILDKKEFRDLRV